MPTQTLRVREARLIYRGRGRQVDATQINAPNDVARLLRPIFRDEPVELFVALLLDTRHRVTPPAGTPDACWLTISRGTISASLVHPREVFRPAIAAGAASVILAHNHPSGDPTPSAEDRTVTERLRKAGELVGIVVLDLVIVCADSFRSAK